MAKKQKKEGSSKKRKALKIGGGIVGGAALLGILSVGGVQGVERYRIEKRTDRFEQYIEKSNYVDARGTLDLIHGSMDTVNKWDLGIIPADYSKDKVSLEERLNSIHPNKVEARIRSRVEALRKDPNVLTTQHVATLKTELEHTQEAYRFLNLFDRLDKLNTEVRPHVLYFDALHSVSAASVLASEKKYDESLKALVYATPSIRGAGKLVDDPLKNKVSTLSTILYSNLGSKHLDKMQHLSEESDLSKKVAEKKDGEKKHTALVLIEKEYTSFNAIRKRINHAYGAIGLKIPADMGNRADNLMVGSYLRVIDRIITDIELDVRRYDPTQKDQYYSDEDAFVQKLEKKIVTLGKFEKRARAIAGDQSRVKDRLARARSTLITSSETVIESLLSTGEKDIAMYRVPASENDTEDHEYDVGYKLSVKQKRVEGYVAFLKKNGGDKTKITKYEKRSKELDQKFNLQLVKTHIKAGNDAVDTADAKGSHVDVAVLRLKHHVSHARIHVQELKSAGVNTKELVDLETKIELLDSKQHVVECFKHINSAKRSIAFATQNYSNWTLSTAEDSLARCETNMDKYRNGRHEEGVYRNVLRKVKNQKVIIQYTHFDHNIAKAALSYEKSIELKNIKDNNLNTSNDGYYNNFNRNRTPQQYRNDGDYYLRKAQANVDYAKRLDAKGTELEKRVSMIDDTKIILKFGPVNKSLYNVRNKDYDPELITDLHSAKTYIDRELRTMNRVFRKYSDHKKNAFYKKKREQVNTTVAKQYAEIAGYAKEIGLLIDDRQPLREYRLARDCLAVASRLDPSYRHDLEAINRDISEMSQTKSSK